MKLKFIAVLSLSIVLVLVIAGIAVAQSRCDQVTVESTGQAPGDQITVCGYAYTGDTAIITWDGIQITSAVGDQYEEFCATFTIPTDASNGSHDVGVSVDGDVTYECSDAFVVAGAATAPAAEVPVVAATPATLPATGFMLVPAAGLLAGGIGTLLFRKRHR